MKASPATCLNSKFFFDHNAISYGADVRNIWLLSRVTFSGGTYKLLCCPPLKRRFPEINIISSTDVKTIWRVALNFAEIAYKPTAINVINPKYVNSNILDMMLNLAITTS